MEQRLRGEIMVQEQKMTGAELDSKEQAQFEKEYEQWCFEAELAKAKYRVIDNSESRNLAHQKN